MVLHMSRKLGERETSIWSRDWLAGPEEQREVAGLGGWEGERHREGKGRERPEESNVDLERETP